MSEMFNLESYVNHTARQLYMDYLSYKEAHGELRPVSSVSQILTTMWQRKKEDKHTLAMAKEPGHLRDVKIEISEYRREAFFTNSYLIDLRMQNPQKFNLLNSRELSVEVNASQCIIIEGLKTISEVYRLMSLVGDITPFFSDPRAEDGRVIWKNRPFRDWPKIPKVLWGHPVDIRLELLAWSTMPGIPYVSNSQLHMVYYLFQKDGEILVVGTPHVDFATVESAINFTRGVQPWRYHQTASSKKYKLGTGLYVVGSRIFESIVENLSDSGQVGEVIINRLDSPIGESESLVVADRINQRIKYLADFDQNSRK